MMGKNILTPSRFFLLLILLGGLGLRMIAVQFGLPHLYHADEPIVVNHALAYGTGDLNPHFFKIPPLVSYLLFLIYGFYYGIGTLLGFFHHPQDFEFLFYRDPTTFYLLARIIFGVLPGTATIYVLYRLIATHFGRQHGLVAAFLLSVCFLHVRDSHYVYADIPLALILVAAFFPIWRLIDNGNHPRGHILCGIMLGLAAATKYNGIALFVPYAVAAFLAAHKRKIFTGLLIGITAAFLTYAVLNPYSILDGKFFCKEISTQAHSHGFVGWTHHFQYSLEGALGLSLLLTALAGMLLLRRYEKKRLSVAAFIVFYYLLICLRGQPYDRYVLPLLPFLIFFAADFLWYTANRFSQYRAVLMWGMACIIAAEPFTASVFFDAIMLAKDTRTQAKEWIETHIPDGSRLALDGNFYMPRLRFDRLQLAEKKAKAAAHPFFSRSQMRRIEYLLNHNERPSYALYFLSHRPNDEFHFLFGEPAVPFDLGELRKRNIQYVLTLTSTPDGKSPRQAFYDYLAQTAEPVKEFNPYHNAVRQISYDRQPLTGGPFLLADLMMRERNGQIIRVYRLK